MSNLETTLDDIVQKLQNQGFPNEQAISQGIVLPVLVGLGWNVFDTGTVQPEYSTGEGRADFALCHPSGTPKAFIEVKQLGGAEKGVRQALEYAFHTGVQFIALTDGRTWSFYLPAEPGSYEDRRVFKLDLFEHSASRSADVLGRYLRQEEVASGEALETARNEYRSQNRRAVARQAIPNAWREIVDNKDELLVDLLGETVESKIGVRPDERDLASFLDSLSPAEHEHPPPQAASPVGTVDPPPRVARPEKGESGGGRSKPRAKGTLYIRGREYRHQNAKEALVIVLTELGKTDSGFFARCYSHPAFSGRTRRYFAQCPEDLYPGRPDLQKYHERIADHWLLGTNLNNRKKITLIRQAAEIAGLTFGKDVVVDFAD